MPAPIAGTATSGALSTNAPFSAEEHFKPSCSAIASTLAEPPGMRVCDTFDRPRNKS